MPKDNQQDSNPLDQKQPAGLTGSNNSDAPEPTMPDFWETENLNTPTSSTIPPVITGSTDNKNVKKAKNPKSKNVIAAILGVFLLVGAVTIGVYLTKQRQNINEKAFAGKCDDVYDKNLCNPDGTCKQKGMCFGCCPGHPVTPQPTTTPEQIPQPTPTPSPSPEVSPTPPGPLIASCGEIKAYRVSGSLDNSNNWSLLSSQQLTQLASGDDIYITVSGSVTENNVDMQSIDKARFSVAFEQTTTNQHIWTESTSQKPGTNEYYYKFNLPAGKTSFYIDAQLHDSSTDTWF
jgi:hypothetical protein